MISNFIIFFHTDALMSGNLTCSDEVQYKKVIISVPYTFGILNLVIDQM